MYGMVRHHRLDHLQCKGLQGPYQDRNSMLSIKPCNELKWHSGPK